MNISTCSCNQCWSGKTKVIAFSESVFVALEIQHAMLVCHVCHRHDFRKKFTEYKMCFDFVHGSLWNISLSRKNGARCNQKYTGCPRRNVPDFGRVFLMLKYNDITQNTYVQSWTVTEIMAREFWNFDSCYTLIDYQIHIKTGRNMWFL